SSTSLPNRTSPVTIATPPAARRADTTVSRSPISDLDVGDAADDGVADANHDHADHDHHPAQRVGEKRALEAWRDDSQDGGNAEGQAGDDVPGGARLRRQHPYLTVQTDSLPHGPRDLVQHLREIS